jgi:hypothetical protein
LAPAFRWRSEVEQGFATSTVVHADHVREEQSKLLRCRFRNRTPEPPPFSSLLFLGPLAESYAGAATVLVDVFMTRWD